jgi:uncharacterized delta-60 repeat protein
MPFSANVLGTYKTSTPYIKIDGVWKKSKQAWVKVAGTWKTFFLAGGVLDEFFINNVGDGASSGINSIVKQSDDKILVGGIFTDFNSVASNFIIRLNKDGSIDSSFQTNSAASLPGEFISSIAVQSDGKIVAGGNFSSIRNVTVNNIIRLNSDGTNDSAFISNTGTGANGAINVVLVQADGKILLAGAFTSFNGTSVNRLARLNSNGTLDTSFVSSIGTGASGSILSMAIQPSDDKIVLGGDFVTFNGTTVNRLVRLNSSGTRDTSFTTAIGTAANSSVSSIAIQPNLRIVLGGLFTSFNGSSVNRLIRLNSNGTLDSAFISNIGDGPNSSIVSLAVQPDSKIIIGGNFSLFNNSAVPIGIRRFNADGTADLGFSENLGEGTLGAGTNGIVRAINILGNGSIVFGGNFSAISGVFAPRIAAIGSDLVYPTT